LNRTRYRLNSKRPSAKLSRNQSRNAIGLAHSWNASNSKPNYWQKKKSAWRRRRRQFERIGECFRDSIHAQMKEWGVLKAEGQRFTFSVKKNPPAVEVTDEAAIPPEFIDYKPSVNKTGLKLALSEGEVPDARLTQSTRLEIK
jgi:hypothetical protein